MTEITVPAARGPRFRDGVVSFRAGAEYQLTTSAGRQAAGHRRDRADRPLPAWPLLDFCLELEERTGLIIEPADVLAETTLNAVVKLLADRGQAGNR